jgi:hypothetical protein
MLSFLLSLFASTVDVEAFDRCGAFFSNSQELRDFVFDQAVRNAPLKYFAKAQSIAIDVSDGGLLIPYSTDNGHGITVFYPFAFPAVLCRLVLANYLDVDAVPAQRHLPAAARAAADCMLRRPYELCLIAFSHDLQARYASAFNKLPENQRALAYDLVRNALSQVAHHEYAHRLLDPSPERIDAEFEADFYALMQSVLAGDIQIAMGYFFRPMAAIESLARKERTPYESYRCRELNVYAIQQTLGVWPTVLIRGVDRGSMARHKQMAIDELTTRTFTPPHTCRPLSAKMKILVESRDELKLILELVANHADEWPVNRPGPHLREDHTKDYLPLMDRILAIYEKANHLKSLEARLLSLLSLSIVWSGDEVARLTRILDHAKGDMLASDFGRLLGLAGYLTFHLRRDLSLDDRARLAEPMFEKSVALLPTNADGWLNLELIAILKSDCARASTIAEKGMEFESFPNVLEALRDVMKTKILDCAALAKMAREALEANASRINRSTDGN